MLLNNKKPQARRYGEGAEDRRYWARGVPRHRGEKHLDPFSASPGRIKGTSILARRASGVKMASDA